MLVVSPHGFVHFLLLAFWVSICALSAVSHYQCLFVASVSVLIIS